MTGNEWALLLLGYGIVVTVLFVIVLGAYGEQQAELHKLRRQVHPSTRNRKANR